MTMRQHPATTGTPHLDPGHHPSPRLPQDDDFAAAWEGPTLGELAERVEHQFGRTPALSSIYSLGFERDESLTPSDVHRVCDLLGLPAADFDLSV